MSQTSASLPCLLPLFLPILLARQSLCQVVDSQFQACRNQTTCGSLNISFPFFIQGQQRDFCGFPRFGISCTRGQPILNLSNSQYIIREIDYESQSVRVSNAAVVWNWTNSCESPWLIQNLTLTDGRFGLKPGVRTLFLFYNCNNSNISSSYSSTVTSSLLSKYRVNCSGLSAPNGSTLLGLFGDDPDIGEASGSCTSLVEAPVEGNKGGNVSELAEALIGRGFGMRWTASNCSICEASGGRCGYDYEVNHFKCFCPDRPHAWRCNLPPARKNDTPLKIGLGTGIGTLSIIVILMAIFMMRYRRMHPSSKVLSKNNSSENSLMSELAGSHVYFEVPIFQNKELEEATNNFHSSQELGDGGFGTVYYGKLRDGREVAVKRLYENNYRRVKQFMTEVQILTRLHHKNLVSLYGCTSRQSRELLLVYEYVPNGTVADHLHGDRTKEGPLPWHIRMSIAVETATALAYLHASDIIHRDVKTNNILLDNNFCVKVGDFGLSRLFRTDVTHVSTAPQGTPGYVDPEYHQCYQLTEKSDVYSFGVVLVELLSSLPAVDISRDRHEINLANLAINRIQKRALHQLIDPRLGFDSVVGIREMITGVTELAFMCLQQEKEMRPSMVTVLEQLNAIAGGRKAADESKRFSLSPESDEAVLLKKTNFPSPISVTQKWVSSGSSCTPSTSA